MDAGAPLMKWLPRAIWPNIWNAFLTVGSVQGMWCPTHLSTMSGPLVLRKIWSIQSAAGQPLAAPLARPIDQGYLPAWEILVESATMSSQVVGGVQPLAWNCLGLYQMVPLLLAFGSTPYRWPLKEAKSIQA